MELNAGEYLGYTLWERVLQGLRLTLSAYQPGSNQPWHRHAHPTFFILLAGDHRDHTKHGTHSQAVHTLVYHPSTTDHASELGPGLTRGLNIEYELEWLSRHQLVESDLRDYRTFQSAQARLASLRFLATAFHPGQPVEADLETQALEFLAPLVKYNAIEPNTPRWFRKADDFLHASFREPISLRDAAHEAGVHPVYLARVFRRVHGCSVSEYLRTLRLTAAARLVMQGDSARPRRRRCRLRRPGTLLALLFHQPGLQSQRSLSCT